MSLYLKNAEVYCTFNTNPQLYFLLIIINCTLTIFNSHTNKDFLVGSLQTFKTSTLPQNDRTALGRLLGLRSYCLSVEIMVASKEDVEKCKQKDLLEQTMSEMIGEFPALHQTIVAERDIYLTHTLRQAARCVEAPPNAESVYSAHLLAPSLVFLVGLGDTV